MGAMGALVPVILKNRLLAPAMFVDILVNLRVLNKNLINTQHPHWAY